MLPWPLATGDELRERLLHAWSTGRGYHDERHLAEVLDRLDELGAHGTEVALAAWFHDAVYETSPQSPGATSNEELSARMATRELEALGVPGLDVAEVARLVRLTEHHDPAPGDTSGEQLCDADLAILAAAPERYRQYAADVRRDFAAVPDADFTRGRLAVLRDLTGRDHLFRTAYGRAHWDAAARVNLAAEISALEASCGDAAPPR
ncbi:hypothetical protein [Nocardioides sp. AE5]|uniref:HD domain-containing protein n=1 Tax=Nocardioides sp. AE5 TaxID=2962573 RepID=UPI0028825AD2|nr:hypothetical protein [Nocardioides sp. AE5]MDT0203806.1 hypothetical protein [Nocardioides sp. AE5]